jgi:hypothetical protein
MLFCKLRHNKNVFKNTIKAKWLFSCVSAPDVWEMCQIYSKLSILLKFRFESHYYLHVRRTQRILTDSEFKSKYFHINTFFEF